MTSKDIITAQRFVSGLISDVNRTHDVLLAQFRGTNFSGFGVMVWCDKHGFDELEDRIEKAGLIMNYQGSWSKDNHERSLDELWVTVPDNWQPPKDN